MNKIGLIFLMASAMAYGAADGSGEQRGVKRSLDSSTVMTSLSVRPRTGSMQEGFEETKEVLGAPAVPASNPCVVVDRLIYHPEVKEQAMALIQALKANEADIVDRVKSAPLEVINFFEVAQEKYQLFNPLLQAVACKNRAVIDILFERGATLYIPVGKEDAHGGFVNEKGYIKFTDVVEVFTDILVCALKTNDSKTLEKLAANNYPLDTVYILNSSLPALQVVASAIFPAGQCNMQTCKTFLDLLKKQADQKGISFTEVKEVTKEKFAFFASRALVLGKSMDKARWLVTELFPLLDIQIDAYWACSFAIENVDADMVYYILRTFSYKERYSTPEKPALIEKAFIYFNKLLDKPKHRTYDTCKKMLQIFTYLKLYAHSTENLYDFANERKLEWDNAIDIMVLCIETKTPRFVQTWDQLREANYPRPYPEPIGNRYFPLGDLDEYLLLALELEEKKVNSRIKNITDYMHKRALGIRK